MNNIVRLILSMSISGSALIMILMLLKPLFKEGFSKTWQYYIWIIVLVRLLVPYSPEYSLVNDLFHTRIVSDITIPQSTVNDPANHNTGDTTNIIQQGQGQNEASPTTQTPAIQAITERVNSLDLWEIAGYLWMIGILLLLLIRISRYMFFINKIKRNAEPITDSQILLIYQRAVKEFGFRKRPQIYYSGQIASPMLIGLRKPIIFLTDTTIHMEGESLYYVLRHELMHYKRHDLWYKWCCDITLCIHWFNPLVYMMSRYINEQCEISCDESLAKDLTPEEKLLYGDILLNAVTENIKYHHQILSSTLYEDKKSLKERILSIMNAKRKSKWIIALSVLAALILCVAAFWLGAYTSAKGEPDNGAKSTDTATDITDIATGITGVATDITAPATDITDTSSDNPPVDNSATTITPAASAVTPAVTDTAEANGNIIYSNTKYGFDFTLPKSWEGYSIVSEVWQGTALAGTHAGEVIESGEKLSIRHPDWTTKDPYQDIPIMVFTIKQWDLVEKEEIALGAAPIGPSKLGSNSQYVFALPARYNFAYPTGFEDVEKIMESKPLVATENIK